MKALRSLPLIVALLALCCLALVIAPIAPPELGGFSFGGSHYRRKGYNSGAYPPGGGSCDTIGQDFPDNPFRGWPVDRFVGSWSTISSWFCDPFYFAGYTHWGIDLSSRISLDLWESLDGAPVVSTAIKAVVTGAANDGNPNHGMGNYVIIRHVTCHERCGSKPADPLEGQHVFVLAANSFDCPLPTPVPGTPRFEQYEDLLLDCRESGWKASYFHLKDTAVAVGDLVERDQVLGWIDNTGNSTGPHLHYQINRPADQGGDAIDPAPAMCDDYTNELRGLYRHEMWECQHLGEP